MRDVESGKVDVVVVYKVDRLSRSLLDFTRIVDLFDRHKVSFVSVTQHFNTTSSMGSLTLNFLLSFAQFEREIIGERILDGREPSGLSLQILLNEMPAVCEEQRVRFGMPAAKR